MSDVSPTMLSSWFVTHEERATAVGLEPTPGDF